MLFPILSVINLAQYIVGSYKFFAFWLAYIFCQSGIEWANAFCCNQSFSLLIIFVPNWHEQVYGLSISWKLQTISFPVVRFFGALPMAYVTAKKMKFSIKDFFSKCTQIRNFLRVRSHLLEKSSIQNFNFCEVQLRN